MRNSQVLACIPFLQLLSSAQLGFRYPTGQPDQVTHSCPVQCKVGTKLMFLGSSPCFFLLLCLLNAFFFVNLQERFL
jgi:hypothetical protein